MFLNKIEDISLCVHGCDYLIKTANNRWVVGKYQKGLNSFFSYLDPFALLHPVEVYEITEG
jgi:hypothetical protein